MVICLEQSNTCISLVKAYYCNQGQGTQGAKANENYYQQGEQDEYTTSPQESRQCIQLDAST